MNRTNVIGPVWAVLVVFVPVVLAMYAPAALSVVAFVISGIITVAFAIALAQLRWVGAAYLGVCAAAFLIGSR